MLMLALRFLLCIKIQTADQMHKDKSLQPTDNNPNMLNIEATLCLTQPKRVRIQNKTRYCKGNVIYNLL